MEAVKTDTMMEQKMEQSGALMVKTAKGMQITNNAEFERGNEVLKEIKTRVKAVKEYWKGPKAAAQAAHKELVAKEAQMLKPLEEAEGIIKKAMLAYDAEVKRKRREAEEAARKAREEEVRRLEAIAAQAEAQGDEDTAEIMRDMAEEVPIGEITAQAAPTSKGLSVRTTWKARVTDSRLVPAYYGEMELRTINTAALNNIARYTGGKAEIPGVEFYEDSTMSVRA